MRARLLAALLIAAVPVAVLAQPAVPATEPVGAGNVLQLTLSLAAVVAAIFGVGWLFRRMQGLPGSSHRALRVIATLPVGTRERIAIIQAGDAQVLIGLSPGRIQTLHVLEHPVPEQVRPPAFKSILERERTHAES
jgi:flagellar protein FliO/FliZ